jgi:hypothetical protein
MAPRNAPPPKTPRPTRTTARCLAAAAVIAGTQAAIWRLESDAALDAQRVADFDVARLPYTLGDWVGKDTDPAVDVVREVGAIRLIERTYVSGRGRRLSVSFATFPTGKDVLPHPPDLCYSGQGWNVLSETWETDATGRPYKLLRVEKGGQVVLVPFWYQLGSNVVSNRNELRRVLQKLRWNKQPWPPFVKVMIHAPAGYPEANTQAACEEFGALVYEWVKENSGSE